MPASQFNAAITGVVNPSTRQGGTLRLAATDDCDSWDPARTYYSWCWDMQRLVTRTLLGFASRPGKAGSQLVPDLAEGLGQHNSDFTRWTYTLKPDLRWETGQAITSSDLKYGIERLFAVDVINGGPASYYMSLLDRCDAEGVCRYKGPYRSSGGLSSIRTPDDRTIEFVLNRPFASFDYLMALPASAPVPRAEDTGATYGRHPVSSGPFTITSYSPGRLVVFERNPQWAQSTDQIRRPLVSSVTLTVYANGDEVDRLLRAGSVDLTADGGVQWSFAQTILKSPALKAYADNPTTGFVRYLAVMQKVAPLNNKYCRAAIFYAIHKADLQLARGGPILGGSIANSMTPPGLVGHDPAINPYPAGRTGNLKAARAALRRCGKPGGFTINMAYVPEGKGLTVHDATTAALARVGIKVRPLPGRQATYYSTFIGSPANVLRRRIGLAIAGWGPDFPTPYGFWQSIANGNAIRPTGNSNYVSLNDPRVNRLLDSPGASSPEPGVQQAVGAQIDRLVMGDAVYLPFVYDKALYYRNPRLTNIYINAALGGYYDYVNVGITG